MNQNLMICDAPDEIQRQRIEHALIAAGVTIDTLPGCVRLTGTHDDTVLTHDLLHLRPQEISRLCGTTI